MMVPSRILTLVQNTPTRLATSTIDSAVPMPTSSIVFLIFYLTCFFFAYSPAQMQNHKCIIPPHLYSFYEFFCKFCKNCIKDKSYWPFIHIGSSQSVNRSESKLKVLFSRIAERDVSYCHQNDRYSLIFP